MGSPAGPAGDGVAGGEEAGEKEKRSRAQRCWGAAIGDGVPGDGI